MITLPCYTNYMYRCGMFSGYDTSVTSVTTASQISVEMSLCWQSNDTAKKVYIDRPCTLSLTCSLLTIITITPPYYTVAMLHVIWLRHCSDLGHNSIASLDVSVGWDPCGICEHHQCHQCSLWSLYSLPYSN